MLLRFAEIEPPSFDTLLGARFVKIPHPGERVGIGGVDEAYLISDPDHVARVLIGKPSFVFQCVVVVAGVFGVEEGLGDADGFYMFVAEVLHHLAGIAVG